MAKTTCSTDAEDKLLAAICYSHSHLPEAALIDRVRQLGVEVVSSGDLVQRFSAVWNADDIASHRAASEKLYRSVEFVVDFFRSTPATAMFPLFLLIFGIGDFAKIAVAAFAAWLVVVFNVAYGVMNARQTRILAARVMGASSWRVFRDVMFFESLPQTFVGLRMAVSVALVVIIVAEMFIGSSDGLGRRMPWTMAAFALASVSMVGIPPASGFVSKWYLVLGSLERGSTALLGVLLAATMRIAALPRVAADAFGGTIGAWRPGEAGSS